MTHDLRISNRHIPACAHKYRLPQTHVLVRRRRIPVDPGRLQIRRRRRKDFNRESVLGAALDCVSDVKLVAPIRPHYRCRIGEASAVQPDVRPVVDAIEVERDALAAHCRRHAESSAVPPGHSVRTLRIHCGVNEVRADGERRARQLAEIHPEERIAIEAVLDEGAYHRRGHGRAVPVCRTVGGRGNRRAVNADLCRRLNHPAIVQHLLLLRLCPACGPDKQSAS